MKAMYLGKVVQQQRKMLGVSQEMVCEGLCTTMTLSRFEGGRQTPSRDCVTAILQRLGLPDDRYYAQLTRSETNLVRLRKEVLACYSRFERSLETERQQARMKTLEKLHDLERCTKEDDRINQQFIVRIKASLGIYPPQKQLELLLEAIHLTSPRLNLEELSSCLYCTDEVVIINKIAISYSCCGQRGKAIEILEQLLKLVLKRTPDHSCLPLIAYNYALQLAMEKRLEEALEISGLGQQFCVDQEHYYLLPRFLHIEAKCFHLMGDTNKCIESIRSAYYIYGAIMNMKGQEVLKTDAEKHFNLVL